MLGVGDSEGNVQLWDVANTKIIRTMRGHAGRIATMDWNQHILASGGREGDIHLHDVRIGDHHVATLRGHSQVYRGGIHLHDVRIGDHHVATLRGHSQVYRGGDTSS